MKEKIINISEDELAKVLTAFYATTVSEFNGIEVPLDRIMLFKDTLSNNIGSAFIKELVKIYDLCEEKYIDSMICDK